MLSITTIPFDDIELFLSANDCTVPSDLNLAYDVAFEIMEKNEYSFIPNNLNEWLIAFNLSKTNKKLKMYNEHDIILYSINELCDLAELLNTDNLDKNHLINILNYLNKVKNLNISSCPNDILLYMLKFMDLRSTISLCETCKSIIAISKDHDFKNLLISKFVNNNFNMSNFTMKQILFCAKSCPVRNKMSIINDKLYNRQINHAQNRYLF